MNHRLVFLLLTAGLIACTQSPIPVHFQSLCAEPEPDSSTGGCKYSAECELVNVAGRIYWDINARGTVYAPLQMNNQLEPNDDPSAGRVNDFDAYVTEFQMEYALDGVSLSPAVSHQNLTVPAGGSGTAEVQLVTVGVASAVADLLVGNDLETWPELIVSVKASGKLRSGGEFTSDPYTIPVLVVPGQIGGEPDGYACCPPGNGQTAFCVELQ
jgi:hypothetical protein